MRDGEVGIPPPDLRVPKGAYCLDSVGQTLRRDRPNLRRPFRVLYIGGSGFNLRDPNSVDRLKPMLNCCEMYMQVKYPGSEWYIRVYPLEGATTADMLHEISKDDILFGAGYDFILTTIFLNELYRKGQGAKELVYVGESAGTDEIWRTFVWTLRTATRRL